jgi:hypothetical protein
MLTRSDEAATRSALGVAGSVFKEHDAASGHASEGFASVREGLTQHGIDVGAR